MLRATALTLFTLGALGALGALRTWSTWSTWSTSGTAPAAPEAPDPVTPFPTGLSGTIVFSSDLAGPGNPSGRPHVYTIDLGTGAVRALTRGADWRDENPRWSRDGRRIAFKSTRARGDYDLYVIDADGGGVTQITDDPANDHDPVWMPDGESLVFMSERDSRGDLYRVWLSDRRVERLTRNFVGRAMMPSVSPDGRSVAFAAQSLERMQFWLFQTHLLDLASGRVRAFGAAGGSCWPSWSPDGRLLARVLLDEEPSVLQVISVDGAPIRQVAGDPTLWHYYPEFSPDGHWLAFSVSPQHHAGEDWDLAVATNTGGEFRRLTKGPGNDRSPDWRP